uniref:Uncharacterized protein n=1 Tax=viral metagenome TaxID=1070528 RepID=A0A6M3K8I9_9ZZZZ
MVTYDQDGNRCDFDLSPAKFITIADHLAALAEKEERLDSLLAESIILARQKDELKEQVATLKANAAVLSSEVEWLRARVVLTPSESIITMPAALKEGGGDEDRKTD